MLELTTINTTELTNKKLGTQLNAIKKAVDTGNNQQWKIATIVDDELFVDDFETEGNLAKVLVMSRPNLNKMKRRHTTTDDDSLAQIKNLIDTLNRDELLEVKEYIEKRL